MIIIAIFNNKGGVGKTTYLYHLANLIADNGKKVLMVDCDSQCNLTNYSLTEEVIERSWSEEGNSIYQVIKPIHKGIGDFIKRDPTRINNNLYIVPGDIDLSIFEDRLGETWSSARNQESSLRVQIAIYRYIKYAGISISADYVFVDMGPNLGALNRAVIGCCDYFITPVSPDLFSIKGSQNLGDKFIVWSDEWRDIIEKWNKESFEELPVAKPKFLGYVVQQHNLRNTQTGMTKAWSIFGARLNQAINNNIVNKLSVIGQTVCMPDYNLGQIPNLHSLIPYSQEARKPVYKCTAQDGLKGAHITTARESSNYYRRILEILLSL